jgi:hypothetical protein
MAEIKKEKNASGETSSSKRAYEPPAIIEEAAFAKLQASCSSTASPPCQRARIGS